MRIEYKIDDIKEVKTLLRDIAEYIRELRFYDYNDADTYENETVVEEDDYDTVLKTIEELNAESEKKQLELYESVKLVLFLLTGDWGPSHTTIVNYTNTGNKGNPFRHFKDHKITEEGIDRLKGFLKSSYEGAGKVVPAKVIELNKKYAKKSPTNESVIINSFVDELCRLIIHYHGFYKQSETDANSVLFSIASEMPERIQEPSENWKIKSERPVDKKNNPIENGKGKKIETLVSKKTNKKEVHVTEGTFEGGVLVDGYATEKIEYFDEYGCTQKREIYKGRLKGNRRNDDKATLVIYKEELNNVEGITGIELHYEVPFIDDRITGRGVLKAKYEKEEDIIRTDVFDGVFENGQFCWEGTKTTTSYNKELMAYSETIYCIKQKINSDFQHYCGPATFILRTYNISADKETEPKLDHESIFDGLFENGSFCWKGSNKNTEYDYENRIIVESEIFIPGKNTARGESYTGQITEERSKYYMTQDGEKGERFDYYYFKGNKTNGKYCDKGHLEFTFKQPIIKYEGDFKDGNRNGMGKLSFNGCDLSGPFFKGRPRMDSNLVFFDGTKTIDLEITKNTAHRSKKEFPSYSFNDDYLYKSNRRQTTFGVLIVNKNTGKILTSSSIADEWFNSLEELFGWSYYDFKTIQKILIAFADNLEKGLKEPSHDLYNMLEKADKFIFEYLLNLGLKIQDIWIESIDIISKMLNSLKEMICLLNPSLRECQIEHINLSVEGFVLHDWIYYLQRLCTCFSMLYMYKHERKELKWALQYLSESSIKNIKYYLSIVYSEFSPNYKEDTLLKAIFGNDDIEPIMLAVKDTLCDQETTAVFIHTLNSYISSLLKIKPSSLEGAKRLVNMIWFDVNVLTKQIKKLNRDLNNIIVTSKEEEKNLIVKQDLLEESIVAVEKNIYATRTDKEDIRFKNIDDFFEWSEEYSKIIDDIDCQLDSIGL